MEHNRKVVILANGEFPTGGPALRALEQADIRICCDGAAARLLEAGWEADVIVGDMDSLSEKMQDRFSERILRVEDQDCNDLTKAVRYCVLQAYERVVILGATGLREDHSLGNISLLTEYASAIGVRMLSNYGEFFLVRSGDKISSRKGEQFSIFCLDNTVKVRSEGLLFAMDDLQLTHWYTASLNEATGESVRLHFKGDYLIVYRSFG